MKTAALHHQFAPGQDPYVSEVDRNTFATLKRLHKCEAYLRHGRVQLCSLSFAAQPARIPQLKHWLACLVG